MAEFVGGCLDGLSYSRKADRVVVRVRLAKSLEKCTYSVYERLAGSQGDLQHTAVRDSYTDGKGTKHLLMDVIACPYTEGQEPGPSVKWWVWDTVMDP